jgi:hypothetical protein
MIEIELDLGDLSYYDSETLASANEALFLCEEECGAAVAQVCCRASALVFNHAQHLLYDYCTRKEKPIDSGVDTACDC